MRAHREAAIAADPERLFDFRAVRAEARLGIGDLAGAKEDADAVIARGLDLPAAWFTRANLALHEGDVTHAMDAINRAIGRATDERRATYRCFRARLKELADDRYGARAEIDAALRDSPARAGR